MATPFWHNVYVQWYHPRSASPIVSKPWQAGRGSGKHPYVSPVLRLFEEEVYFFFIVLHEKYLVKDFWL